MLSSKRVPLEFQSKPGKFKKFHKIKLEKAIKFVSRHKVDSFVMPIIQFMPVKTLLAPLKIVKPSLKKLGRKKSKLNLTTWPIHILTKKPKDIRMGRGKGMPTDRVSVVGKVPLFSIYRAEKFKLKNLMLSCKKKLYKSKNLQLSKW